MSRYRLLPSASLALLLAACQGNTAPAPIAPPASSAAQSAEAESTINGATVHVNIVQTSQLPDSVMRQYRITRSPRTVLLLVNLRNVGKAPAPAISATVTDLQGHASPVALRELQVAPPETGTVDYIGTVDVTLPDTLRFTVVATRGGATSMVQVSRDFYPQ